MHPKKLIDSNTVNWQIAPMPRSTPSHSGLKLSPQPSSFASLQDLAEAVNDWCAERGFVPVSGQAAANLSERSLRYYRTLGLLDGPQAGEGTYGERHFLQLAAIRALQSRGMPLRRIQELLYGRDNANLRELLTRAKREQQPVASMPPFSAETWNVTPLEGSFALIGRDGARPTAAQVAAIRALQSRGMPLRRIQELLYGRDNANLRELLTRAKSELQPVATMPPFSAETWNVTPLAGSFALIGRDGARPTAAQVTAINRILQKQKVTSR